jgi:cell division protein FtsB
MIKAYIQKIGRILYSRSDNYAFLFYSFIFLLVAMFLLTTTLAAHIKNSKLEAHYNQINKDIEKIKADNNGIRQEMGAITRDPFYLEKVIRKELKMQGEGEIVINQAKKK